MLAFSQLILASPFSFLVLVRLILHRPASRLNWLPTSPGFAWHASHSVEKKSYHKLVMKAQEIPFSLATSFKINEVNEIEFFSVCLEPRPSYRNP